MSLPPTANTNARPDMSPSPQLFSHPTLPEARFYSGTPFPLLLTPPPHLPHLSTDPAAAHAYLAEHRQHIQDLLQKHAVLLFRHFAQTTPEHFATLVATSLRLPNFPYLGGNAVRTPVVGDRVFTANESPPDKPIPFHHELAQTATYPSALLFFCAREPASGGETPILYSPAVYEALRVRCPDFLATIETHGVRYMRIMTAFDRPHSAIGRGWKATFGVTCRDEAEVVLKKKGYQWEWLGEGGDAMLKEISPVLKAVYEAADGRKSFFNQLVAVWGGWRDELNKPDGCVVAGDGSPLDKDAMDIAAELMLEHRVAVPWKVGDVMYIDNMMAQHSRASFTGPRRVLASLVK